MAAAANWTGKLLLWAYPPIVACEAFLDWFFPSTVPLFSLTLPVAWYCSHPLQSINRISREPEYITTQRNVVTSMVVAMTVAWGRTGTYYGNAVVGFFLGTFASSLLVGRAPADYEERAQQEQAQAAPQGNSVIVEEVMEDGKIVRL